MSKEFDPYNFDYKSYIKEIYRLDEMPSKIIKDKWVLDDYILNNKEGIKTENNSKFIKIFHAGSLNFRLFFDEENNISFYSLLDMNTPFINAQYSFERITIPINGIINLDIWNHVYSRGLISYFFDHYILQKEKTIISDKIQTEKGFKFWKSLFKEYVKTNKTHQMYIMDFSSGNKIKDVTEEKDLDEFYGSEKSKYRFVLNKNNNEKSN